MESNPLACSFCGRDPTEVRELILGPNEIYICDLCVIVNTQILRDNHPDYRDALQPTLADYLEIPEATSDYILGYFHALRSLRRGGRITDGEFAEEAERLAEAVPVAGQLTKELALSMLTPSVEQDVEPDA